MTGVGEQVLARALPAWTVVDDRLTVRPDGAGQASWRVGGTVAGPVVFGCRSCTGRRTGSPVRVMRYAPRWQRVCVRHGRWAFDADADQPLEYLNLRGVSEVVAAQRRWPVVARRARRAGVDAGQVFAVAHAVVAHWWDQALYWEREEIWPRRLHLLAGGDAGAELGRWRVVGRDAAVFPEAVAVAEALLDPAMASLAWRLGDEARPGARVEDDPFCGRLGERLGREWLGPLIAADYDSALGDFSGALVRARRGVVARGWRDDPWRLRAEREPVALAGQLRVLAAEARTGGSGTRWGAAVPGEQRWRIEGLVAEACEELEQVHGVQSGTTAEVAQRLLRHLSRSADLLDRALMDAAAGAVAAGVALEDVAGWCRVPAGELAEILAGNQED